MGEILINYEEVYSRTAAMKCYIRDELLAQIESEYEQIQAMLENVDGATNAGLQEAMEANKKKSIAVANVMDKMLTFMANSSKEFEENERAMARDIMPNTNGTQGGVK